MTRYSIVQKLDEYLRNKRIDSEDQVVYLLAEVRKLDEMTGKKAPQALRMFLHWALHVDLDGANTIKTFVERIDEVVTTLLSSGGGTPEAVAAESALYREVTYFDQFRSELWEFLARWGLPIELCDDNQRWFEFVAAYTRVIEDGSLVGKDKQTVETVTFVKDDRANVGNGLSYKWLIMFNQPHTGHHGIALSVCYQRDEKRSTQAWALF